MKGMKAWLIAMLIGQTLGFVANGMGSWAAAAGFSASYLLLTNKWE